MVTWKAKEEHSGGGMEGGALVGGWRELVPARWLWLGRGAFGFRGACRESAALV